MFVIVKMHMSEDAVDVASRLVVGELPLLELLDGLIWNAQFCLAQVAIDIKAIFICLIATLL